MECPHCHHHFTPTHFDRNTIEIQNLHCDHTGNQKCGRLIHIVCPNSECKKTIIFLYLEYGYSGLKFFNKMIYPDKKIKQYPDYIPEQIREDYEEACKIVELSPKASATLARRCLQGIIRDFYDITKPRLCDEVNAIQEKVDAELFDAINAVRMIGNIGAHMEKDVNLVVDIEPEEAQQLINLIELLFEETYIRREDRKKRLQAIKQINEDKQAQRQGTAGGTAS